jgi:Flp pilus assembly protein TadD
MLAPSRKVEQPTTMDRVLADLLDAVDGAFAASRFFETEIAPTKAAVKPLATNADGDLKPAAEKPVVVNKKPVPSPVSLSCLDGQQMVLEKCDVRVAMHGPLSLVETEMVFRNTENRVREGRFLYLLPTGATISRFAKEVDGKLMEGEVLERMRAQAVYTEILHGMRDPALLETDQGNRFSARVFPIPANSTVRLVLSYSRLLPMENSQRKLVIPMAGMPKIGTFTFSTLINVLPGEVLIPSTIVDNMGELRADELKHATRIANDYTPQKDIEIRLDMVGDATAATSFQSGDYQMFSYRMPATDAAVVSTVPSDWNFFIDTSASNADMEIHRLTALENFFRSLPQVRKMSASAFDISVVPLGEFTPETSAKIIAALKDRHALGATHLVEVSKQIGEQARANGKAQHFVLISDGIATLGSRESSDILAALGDWPANDTLHALVIGQKQDSKMLAAIVEKTHGRVIVLPLGDAASAAMPTVLEDLMTPLGSTCSLSDANANWVYPTVINDARPGSEVIFLSELKKGAIAQPVLSVVTPTGAKNSTPLTLTPTPLHDFATLLQREGCRAYLDHLEQLEQRQTAPALRAELRTKRLEASVKNRVLCSLTALLVLETEQDYARFKLSRNALADVLVIGANGIELLNRNAGGQPQIWVPAPKVAVERPRIDPNMPSGQLKTPSPQSAVEVQREKREATGWAGGSSPDSNVEPVLCDEQHQFHNTGNPEGGGGSEGVVFDEGLIGVGGSAGSGTGGGFGGGTGTGVGEGRGRGSFGNSGEKRPRVRYRGESGSASSGTGGGSGGGFGGGADVRTGEAHNTGDNFVVTNNGTIFQKPAEASSKTSSTEIDQKVHQELARLLGKYQRQGPWVQQNTVKPDAETLNALGQLVVLNPLDRSMRNTYADLLKMTGDWKTLKTQAFEWMAFDSENPAVFEYLGKSAAALGDANLALRAYTSIAEVAPNRAALLARSGWLLITVQQYGLAEDIFREALKNRQDDVNIYRGLALTLWMGGKFDAAVGVLENALSMNFNPRYGDAKRVLREELGYVLRSAIAQQEQNKTEEDKTIQEARVDIFKRRAKTANVDLSKFDALRVTLCWETDANDVDLHIIDPNGEDCFYGHKKNDQSGLELYSDQTQGLGPEVIRADKLQNGTYHIGVNYFSAGPMGVSRGVVVIIQNSGMPKVVPFCLVPGGSDMRYLAGVSK